MAKIDCSLTPPRLEEGRAGCQPCCLPLPRIWGEGTHGAGGRQAEPLTAGGETSFHHESLAAD